MKPYDYVLMYFYNYFNKRSDANSDNLAIPLVVLLIGLHIILIIVAFNFITGFNVLVEYFGVRTNQGKFYALPVVLTFLISLHFILKRRLNWLKTHKIELGNSNFLGLNPTQVVSVFFILSIVLIVVFLKL